MTLQVEHEDQRLWKLDLAGGYTVGGVYRFLTSYTAGHVSSISNIFYLKHVPLKVLVFE